MTDIRSYIESGVLELYVLGELSADERLEVEELAEKHPEIRAELTAIETALEAFAHSQGRTPAPRMRDRVLSSIEIPEESGKIASIPQTPKFTSYKYAFAASVALLLISWAALFVVYNRLDASRQQIAVLETSNQKFTNQVNKLSGELKNSLEILNDPNYQLIKLQGTEISKSSRIAVAFNSRSNDVLLDLSGLNMPQNDDEHQYQLWAIVDGQPVDLGVFDVSDQASGLKQMKSVGKPQAFAVTLEKRGGSVKPTMAKLMVIGEV